MVFVSYLQSTSYTMSSFVVRTSGNPSDALPMVRDVVHSLDPLIAITRVATMDEKVSRAIAPRRFNAWLVGFFSSLAVIVAMVGIYGLYQRNEFSSRTLEIGALARLAFRSSGSSSAHDHGHTHRWLALAGSAAVTRSLGRVVYVPPLIRSRL